MDPVDMFQKTAAALMSLAQERNLTLDAVTNTNSTTSTSTSGAGDATSLLTALLTTLLSFSALRDWLKLFFIGGLIETCRRLLFAAWRSIMESFWITATFDYDDSSYDWMMYWLSRHPKWSKARTVEVSTSLFGLNPSAVAVDGDSDSDGNGKLCFLPCVSETYSLWYKHHYMTVTRIKTQETQYRTSETLSIKIFARNHQVLANLLLEAKKTYQEAQEHHIAVHAADMSNNWRRVATRPKRPLKSIVLDPGVKDVILEDARDFLASKQWYQERGIPFRRGYLLYGAPGSGKTSIIQSLAGELGLDVYVISLSRFGLDDSGLSELISDLPEKCIALMEDIDAAFHRGLSRGMNLDEDSNPRKAPGSEGQGKDKVHEDQSCRVTLSGLLNALDGVGAQEGRILFATTNRYHVLDPALCRPGRMDLHIEFKLASKYQAEELFKCFYLPSGMEISESTENIESEKTEGDADSAYASGSSTPSEVDTLIELDTPSSSSPPTSLTPQPSSPLSSALHHMRAPKLSVRQVLTLAARFAAAIPEREQSMANLQGYLMAYKTRPVEAVNDALSWIEKQRSERMKRIGTSSGPAVEPPSGTP